MKTSRLILFAVPAAVTPLLALLPAQASTTTQPMAWGDPARGGPSCGGFGCWESPQPAGPAGAVSVIAENTFNLAIMPNATLETWGQGSQGQLGDGSTRSSRTPVQVYGLRKVTQADGGDSDAIALESDGTVWTWGNNSSGQLGDGSTIRSDVPVQVTLPGPAVQVDAGGLHDYALLANGTVYAWGSGVGGQLGDGTTANHTRPVRVEGLTGVQAISSGNMFGYALMPGGTLKSWGYNRFGQLCDGGTSNRLAPGPVPTLSGVSQVSAGGNTGQDGHVLFLTRSGTVEACGDGASGQLGDGSTFSQSLPVRVSGLPPVTSISAGGEHSLALDTSGNVWAWGDNSEGQVGDGTTTNALRPVEVLSGMSNISAGSLHSLAVLTRKPGNFLPG
jgi:alpha-tubulin suppressor-like RCC1 family protein